MILFEVLEVGAVEFDAASPATTPAHVDVAKGTILNVTEQRLGRDAEIGGRLCWREGRAVHARLELTLAPRQPDLRRRKAEGLARQHRLLGLGPDVDLGEVGVISVPPLHYGGGRVGLLS